MAVQAAARSSRQRREQGGPGTLQESKIGPRANILKVSIEASRRAIFPMAFFIGTPQRLLVIDSGVVAACVRAQGQSDLISLAMAGRWASEFSIASFHFGPVPKAVSYAS